MNAIIIFVNQTTKNWTRIIKNIYINEHKI
jgi:hypothetical protein